MTAKVWDAKTDAEVLTIKGHAGPVISASFSPDSFAASFDNTTKVWDVKTGVEVLAFKGDNSADSSMLFGPAVWGQHRSAGTVRGSSLRTRTARRRSGTPGRSTGRSRWRIGFRTSLKGKDQPVDNVDAWSSPSWPTKNGTSPPPSGSGPKPSGSTETLGDDRQKLYRYNAARAAALAVSAQGQTSRCPTTRRRRSSAGRPSTG